MTVVRPVEAPTARDLAAAEKAVSVWLSPTPVVAASALAPNALLKIETLQPTGSFKIRGALAALAAAPRDRLVVTASAGNHGLGVAEAARLLGRRVSVVVPETGRRPRSSGCAGSASRLCYTATATTTPRRTR